MRRWRDLVVLPISWSPRGPVTHTGARFRARVRTRAAGRAIVRTVACAALALFLAITAWSPGAAAQNAGAQNAGGQNAGAQTAGGPSADARPGGTFPNATESGTIRIATFNLRVFGVTKASHPEVMAVLADIIRHFDLVAVQEIRDASGTAIKTLMDDINQGTNTFAYLVSDRLGRTRSKEQYAFIYNVTKLAPAGAPYVFDDDENGSTVNSPVDVDGRDLFEREPDVAYFRSLEGKFDFVVVDIHTKPDDATREISYLPLVVADAEKHFHESDVLILGDFNADGSYYHEDSYEATFPAGEYIWIIRNDIDTSVAASSNTYDRMVATASMREDFDGKDGVINFPVVYNLSAMGLKPLDVSDHYPTWAEFYTGHDTD